MKRLWAPWRMTYLRKAAKGTKGCFFCADLRSRKDRKNLVLERGRTCFAVMNLYPYTTGHLLVAPLAHKARLTALTQAERAELIDLTVRMQRAIDRVLKPEGYNVGINQGRPAGAGVPGHVHQHIVPRWAGDTNFMSTVGDARVVPQSLEELYDRLQKALRRSR